MPCVIYVDRSGGKWEARYWHTDEQRYFRYQSHCQKTAISLAIKATGYTATNCKLVFS